MNVCLCTIWCMKTQFMFILTNSTIKQEDTEIIIKNMAFIYSVLKPLMSKFQKITRLILGFDSVPQWSGQAVSTYLSGLGQYLR